MTDDELVAKVMAEMVKVMHEGGYTAIDLGLTVAQFVTMAERAMGPVEGRGMPS